jgi:hypothetical protein
VNNCKLAIKEYLNGRYVMRYIISLLFLLAVPLCAMGDSTTVPGHTDRWDEDNNGYPDAGVEVVGHYISFYAYDDYGGWYQDLGDGRTVGTVENPSELDQETLTTCDYENNYRGDFNNDAFLNTGWIMNEILCYGYESGHYTYLIVNESDPRYTGNPDYAIWGTWEYHVLAGTGFGNLVRPMNFE